MAISPTNLFEYYSVLSKKRRLDDREFRVRSKETMLSSQPAPVAPVVNQEDKFIKISLCGLASLLIFQTFIHVGVNTNLIPSTGMTLPFLSYGGSSLIGSAILAGIILNYTKNKTYLYE